MPSLYLVQPKSSGGGQIAAADLNQLVNTLTGNQNTPVNVRNTDPIAYTQQLQNTDAAGKAQLIYGPDGTTVLLRVQGNGVVASPDGTAAATIVTTTHPQTLTGKTFTAPHLTSAVVDSGGLQVTAGNVGIGGAPSSNVGVDTLSLVLSGAATQALYIARGTGNSSGTSEITGFYSAPATQAAAFTAALVAGFHALNPVKGAGSTITSAYGLLVDAITSGNTNNYGLFVNAPSGGSSQNIGAQINGGLCLSNSVAPAIGGAVSIGGVTTGTATTGASGATPAQVAGYWSINVNGTVGKIPYYNA